MILEKFSLYVGTYTRVYDIKFSLIKSNHSQILISKLLINIMTIIPDNSSYEELVDRGFREYKVNNFDISRSLYLQALETNPNGFRAFLGLGDIDFKLSNYNEAIEYYKKTLDSNPKYFRAYHNWGSSLLKMKKYENSIELYKKALRYKPDFSSSLYEMGLSYNSLGQFGKAEICFRKYLDLEPNDIQGQAFLARILFYQGKDKDIQKIVDKLCSSIGWDNNYFFVKELWFFNNIPLLSSNLNQYKDKKNVKMIEIGSFEGLSTCYFSDFILTGGNNQLICIDPVFQPQYWQNINKIKGSNIQIIPIQAKSQFVLPNLDKESYDIIYIDGWHIGWQVLIDALYTWQLVKKDGIIIFDDYLKEDQTSVGQTVKQGVDFFLDLLDTNYNLEKSGRQLIIKKVISIQSIHFDTFKICEKLKLFIENNYDLKLEYNLLNDYFSLINEIVEKTSNRPICQWKFS